MAAILVFLPAVLSGMLLAHILWSEGGLGPLCVKAFLGLGIGLGLRSLLYFLYLLILPARSLYRWFDVALFLCLLIIAVVLERRRTRIGPPTAAPKNLSRSQVLLLLLAGLVFAISLLSTANYLLRRRQGDWDAWMMFNRAARFVYLDQAHWKESFSSQMDPIFHPDYPLLLAMNNVAGWEMLGDDSAAIPMLQSALFALGCVGLAASSLAVVRTIGQAALGLIVLWGIPVFVNEGARQMADVPLAFFILATGTLFYLHVRHRSPGLLVLAGITTGLAAWTKNEGSVLVIGAGAAVLLALRKGSWGLMIRFAAGLALPLAVVLYFKLSLAPAGDIMSAAAGGTLGQLADASRHATVLKYLWSELVGFGSWGIPGIGFGILPILGLYYALFRRPSTRELRSAYHAGFVMLGVQMLGYYAAYLVSPYELSWHLSYSSTRIVLQIFPLLLFLALCASRDVEESLRPANSAATG